MQFVHNKINSGTEHTFHDEVNGCTDTQGPESRHTIEYHLTQKENRGVLPNQVEDDTIS